jgi:DNA-binding MarR family transcriptional regulator
MEQFRIYFDAETVRRGNNMRVSPDQVASEVLDVVPAIMRVIRSEMREHRGADLSVPQFRSMAYLDRNPGASLSELAAYIGLTLPSMSKLVDGLSNRRLLTREIPAGDRRRVTLELTTRGRATLHAAYETAEAQLARRLAAMSEAEGAQVVEALRALRPLFTQAHPVENAMSGRHNGHVSTAAKF